MRKKTLMGDVHGSGFKTRFWVDEIMMIGSFEETLNGAMMTFFEI